MQKDKIQKVKSLACEIDPRINIFDGYSPKITENYKGELLFWRQIVSLYGLFADSNRVQIKTSDNLINLMHRYSLINPDEANFANDFWKDISNLRKWFCHNNDLSLYYAKGTGERIKKYLNSSFVLSTNKPTTLESVQVKDWEILTSNIDRRFNEYLDILWKGFIAWKKSDSQSDLLEDWLSGFAKALFEDKELIMNALAEIAQFEIINQGLSKSIISIRAKQYYRQLESEGFSKQDIINELTINKERKSNKDIILESIKLSRLIL